MTTIADFLGSDHRRLQELWAQCEQAMRACDLDRLRARFADFALALKRHLRMEQEILLPAFEERAGSRMPELVEGVRSDHGEIAATLEALSVVSRAGDCASAIQTIEGQQVYPASLFESHYRKEESVLYPIADRLFGDAIKEQLIARMRNLAD